MPDILLSGTYPDIRYILIRNQVLMNNAAEFYGSLAFLVLFYSSVTGIKYRAVRPTIHRIQAIYSSTKRCHNVCIHKALHSAQHAYRSSSYDCLNASNRSSIRLYRLRLSIANRA